MVLQFAGPPLATPLPERMVHTALLQRDLQYAFARADGACRPCCSPRSFSGWWSPRPRGRSPARESSAGRPQDGRRCSWKLSSGRGTPRNTPRSATRSRDGY
eukprot:12306942-Alexandrium_andersonii.AAC.1